MAPVGMRAHLAETLGASNNNNNNNLIEWIVSILSSQRTTVTMFTWKRIWRNHPARCLGEKINLVQNVSYLGVILNAKLSWKPHIKSRAAKANNCLMICRQTVDTQWGISPKTMHWIYSVKVRPVISYASTVWCAGLEKGTCKGILNTIQRKAYMAISSAFYSTPTTSLEMLVGLLPLDIHIRSVALLGMYRLRQNRLWRDAHIKDTAAHRSHVNLCNQRMQSIACLNFPGDLILPVYYPSLQYSCVIKDSADNEDCTALPWPASRMAPRRSWVRLVQGSLSSGWDVRHLKTPWMIPHHLLSRSAGNHSGSRAIVRVHGISRDWGNHLLLGQQSRHSSGLWVSGKELLSTPMHRSSPNRVHPHKHENKVDQGPCGNSWQWTSWPASKTSYREPFHRAWADNSCVILLL